MREGSISCLNSQPAFLRARVPSFLSSSCSSFSTPPQFDSDKMGTNCLIDGSNVIRVDANPPRLDPSQHVIGHPMPRVALPNSRFRMILSVFFECSPTRWTSISSNDS
ncbi:hypothetical protein DL93DRAFT_1300109 [Clavulina sp. PMI_390]|nr:hypothetical protein DL93DRAFT_158852 [Clavulina sp. PMI_390]KAF8312719.1 hypothetical protein DL93DRAFT_1300109 [Clavulina sp. PMI_390]